MKTQVTSPQAAFYQEHGYIVLRRVLSASLIERLRAMAEEARTITRRINGPQAQRLQPLGDYVDMTALREFTTSPEFTSAIREILSERHTINPPETMAVLFEPTDRCWATNWHRDLGDHFPASILPAILGGRDWNEFATHPDNFNQFNCALYEDTSTWFVPKTHKSVKNTPEQEAAAWAQTLAILDNKDRARGEAEHELFLNDYCASMPGAMQVILQAGDLVLYRSTAWHMGSYVPYRRRATLHGQADTPEFADYKIELGKTLKRLKSEIEAAREADPAKR